jgi:hypothetical protein
VPLRLAERASRSACTTVVMVPRTMVVASPMQTPRVTGHYGPSGKRLAAYVAHPYGAAPASTTSAPNRRARHSFEKSLLAEKSLIEKVRRATSDDWGTKCGALGERRRTVGGEYM